MIIRRKIIWVMILMVWVGMVTSIIIYQGNNYMALDTVSSENVEMTEGIEIIEQGVVTRPSNQDINFTTTSKDTEGQDFFVEYKLERDKARSEQVNIYREMINNPNTDQVSKKEAQQMMLALTGKMEKEMEIESLIRARGYEDALAYIHNKAVDVIIHTNGLEREDVAKIGDIIVKVTGFNTEDVTIIEKKMSQ
ncbi:MAG: SpoIIIAH-like family protein [Halanaerobiales bacterium]